MAKTASARKLEASAKKGQRFEVVSIDSIKQHPKNARRGNVDAIKESISANGFYGACVVQRKTRLILVGNHRWKAAKELGLKQVPVNWVDVNPIVEERMLAADNRTSDLAENDDVMLKAILRDLAENDAILGSAFSQDEVSLLLKGPDAPSGFPQFDGSTKLAHTCPKCGFEFS